MIVFLNLIQLYKACILRKEVNYIHHRSAQHNILIILKQLFPSLPLFQDPTEKHFGEMGILTEYQHNNGNFIEIMFLCTHNCKSRLIKVIYN